MLFSLLLFTAFAQAECPEGHALSRTGSFRAQLGSFVSGRPFRQCVVDDAAVTGAPLEIVGCAPHTEDPSYLLVRAPEGWKHRCFPEGAGTMLVLASEFERKAKAVLPAEAGEECPPPASTPAAAAVPELAAVSAYSGRSDGIGYLVNDLYAADHDVKSVADIEKFHSCLLDRRLKREEERREYNRRYRFMIGEASTATGVPVSLLACLCGRESLFDTGSVSHTNVKGLCQTVGPLLADIEEWRTKYPKAKAEFDHYVRRIGKSLEHQSCAKGKLSRALVAKCPSLSFVLAGIYLKYGYNRIENNAVAYTEIHWKAHDLGTTALLVGGYNTGMPRLAKSLQGRARKDWTRSFLKEVCRKDGPRKMAEVQGQMMSIRACLKDGSWLDHHGKPLLGEACAQAPAESARQQADYQAYARSLETSCP